MIKWFLFGLALVFVTVLGLPPGSTDAAYHFANFKGKPPIHQFGSASNKPSGLSPSQIKAAYNLPTSGGHGTIAIIGAYNDTTIEHDLGVFSTQYNLPACTTANKCLEIHSLGSTYNSGWSMETSLDVEWSHAIAPSAKILLVEAKTPSGANLIAAVDYARSRSDVVAVSMSWGGAEFSDETTLDSHFTSSGGKITFFASSGDNGTGASWPAASPNVVAVGGTHINFSSRKLTSETAWSGSGGGVSAYEKEPSYQADYNISQANGHRAIPDVSYNADPSSGFSVYRSTQKSTKNGWYVFGGTSAGAPQWAAIKSLGLSADNGKFYTDKASASNGQYFRDITTGSNGSCGFYCSARKHYDYVTGLGSPLTSKF
ncbi:MAG TPA: S53 family peptidase [Candidatus Saccharimonadales bacterium]|nr:S53 family peptidase [Candidatus Saccharimonadales bacterium]